VCTKSPLSQWRLQSDYSWRQKIQLLQIAILATSLIYLGLLFGGAASTALVPVKMLPLLLMFFMVQLLGNMMSYGRRVACGLVFCAISDIALELEDLPLFWGYPLFLAGLGLGLLGHLTYVYAFYSQAPVSAFTVAPPVVVAAVIFNVLRPELSPGLLIPVLAYTASIAGMIALALSRQPEGYATAWSWWCGSAGTILFAISATVLAYDRFVATLPQAKLAVAASYLGAQFLICMSARGSQPRPLSKALGSVENFIKGQSFRVDND
jgi:uncharacterized membrane protein YhhN